MAEQLVFQDPPGFRARDFSPDSVIFTVESNFSLFSSASCSVDRCSFASDVPDQDSLASEISQHLAGHGFHEVSSGPVPDPNKSTVQKHSHVNRKVEKAKVQKEVETEDESQALDSARSSFSQALRECQDRKSRSEALLKKLDRRRPASVDLNSTVINVASSSPRFGVMKKGSGSTRRTGAFPSPGTPNYRHAHVGMQKGWSSERVPLHANANRRHVSMALLPYNNGRTLPSKWEDAERWIFSPISGDGGLRPSFPQPQRRPKSKSGPLGPPGAAYNLMYSPAIQMFEGGVAGNLMAGSPFSAGVIAADGLSIRYGRGQGGGENYPSHTEPCMASYNLPRLITCAEVRRHEVQGFLEVNMFRLFNICFLRDVQDEKLDGVKDAATDISRDVSRRDMATQMSPEGSPYSSPRRRPSSSLSASSVLPILELQSTHSPKPEVRDVQVDERVTVTRWSKKHGVRILGKGSENVDDWKTKALEVRSTTWDVSETAKSISKIKREEAKITAWENLQKAKAEAAIRKLEVPFSSSPHMQFLFAGHIQSHLLTAWAPLLSNFQFLYMKLEKKRSSSIEKIINKLRSAQRKAHEMRSSAIANQAHQVARTSHKVISFRRTRQIGSLSGCFTCHAF
ncbi:hypothetical protein RJ639_037473 [Escallonia herrerae]|uniref:Remorin C-terminal domain-containing protein n=1 Tax=Escallonia herrerae TaxID=1293975 RepID=A0AA88WI32_9ASTE|nr:hypothetical protein RJ639_037473 [Escallonia herrerae]